MKLREKIQGVIFFVRERVTLTHVKQQISLSQKTFNRVSQKENIV
jgi:hypothetical protein